MRYIALRHKITGRYLSGTDYSEGTPPRPILSCEVRVPLLFPSETWLFEHEVRKRGIVLANFEVIEIEF